MRIAAVGRALPRNYYDQQTLLRELQFRWRDDPDSVRRLARLSRNVRVEGRNLALPLPEHAGLSSFGATNDAWIEHALALGEEAIGDALERAGFGPRDVDVIFFSSVTGIASPSIDACLVNRMGMRNDIKRVPIFGLGCVAGAATVSRAADYVRAFPDQVAVVLCVELCSLTFQRSDCSVANQISCCLFGDGASAAVVTGSKLPKSQGPKILATRSVFYPDTEEIMGWRVSEQGFRIVLSAGVPSVAREHLGGDVDDFLHSNGLSRSDIGTWVCHPGGPKVLHAVQDALQLSDEDLALSWSNLAQNGNMSSASLLFILAQTMEHRQPPAHSLGIMFAMGPGFCSELLLLRW